jgi:hypothetical protein
MPHRKTDAANAWNDLSIVNHVLKHFDSEPLPPNTNAIESKDKIDAIISAAAIGHPVFQEETWSPAGLTNCARNYEGWIFGVT